MTDWRRALVVALPAALALALTLHGLAARSIWIDESASVTIASQHGHALWAGIAHDGGNMLVYYLVLHVLVGAFGDSELVVRLPSALATAASAGLVSLLALRLFSARAALAAGLLGAVSLPLVFWGQNARSYASMVAFVVASYLAFLALVGDRGDVDDGGHRRWPWIAYVLTTVLGCYMSFVTVLVVPAQLVALAVTRPGRRTLRSVGTALGVAACACVPLALLATRRGSGQLFWVVRPNATGLDQLANYLASSAVLPNFHPTATSDALLVLSGVLVVAAGALGLARRGTFPRSAAPAGASGPGSIAGSFEPASRARWAYVLVVSWLVVPVALDLVESFVGPSTFVPRNLLMCVPAVAVLLGAALTDGRVPRPLGWSVLAVLLVLRGLQVAPSYGVSPENWRAATRDVLAHTEKGDCIAFYPSDGRMAFDYYLGHTRADMARAPRPVLPRAPFDEVRAYVEDYASLDARDLARTVRSCRRLWLVTSHSGEPNGTAASRANFERFRTLVAAAQHDYASWHVTSFGWASPVRVELLARHRVA